MKRTFGAAIGAVLFILFMSMVATRLTPVAAQPAPSGVAASVNP